jgi:hypothetical protein
MSTAKRLASTLAMGILCLGFSTRASASISWMLDSVSDPGSIVFNDGGTASGFFSIDAGGVPTNWDIVAQGGNTVKFPPFEFMDAGAQSATLSLGVYYFGQTSSFSYYINIQPNTNLATALGPVILTASSGQNNAGSPRSVSDGQLVMMPEPGSFGLAVLGLAAAGLARRRIFYS